MRLSWLGAEGKIVSLFQSRATQWLGSGTEKDVGIMGSVSITVLPQNKSDISKTIPWYSH